jgi:transcriptional regulator with XRE-family HTH domain
MLAKNIKKLRKQHKLSHDQLAQKSAYSILIKLESSIEKNPIIEII